MDLDDAKKPNPPLDELEREDLSLMSVAELDERVRRLNAERERAETAIAQKANTRTQAEAAFKGA